MRTCHKRNIVCIDVLIDYIINKQNTTKYNKIQQKKNNKTNKIRVIQKYI